jgi:hypothetical protein
MGESVRYSRSEAVGALITMMQCGVRKPITTIKKARLEDRYLRLLARAREKHNWVIGSHNYLISLVKRLMMRTNEGN